MTRRREGEKMLSSRHLLCWTLVICLFAVQARGLVITESNLTYSNMNFTDIVSVENSYNLTFDNVTFYNTTTLQTTSYNISILNSIFNNSVLVVYSEGVSINRTIFD